MKDYVGLYTILATVNLRTFFSLRQAFLVVYYFIKRDIQKLGIITKPTGNYCLSKSTCFHFIRTYQ